MIKKTFCLFIFLVLQGCTTVNLSNSGYDIGSSASNAIFSDLLPVWSGCTSAVVINTQFTVEFENDVRRTGLGIDFDSNNSLLFSSALVDTKGEADIVVTHLTDDFCRVSRSYSVTAFSITPVSSVSVGVTQ